MERIYRHRLPSFPPLSRLPLDPLGSLANALDSIREVINRPTSETVGVIVRLQPPFSSLLLLSHFQYF